MKIEQVRKIKSIESEFLKLSKDGAIHLSMASLHTDRNFLSATTESLIVELRLFDNDLGDVGVSIEAKSLKQVENLRVILEMLQGSV